MSSHKAHHAGHSSRALFLIGITLSVEFIRQIAASLPTYELAGHDRVLWIERVKEEQLHELNACNSILGSRRSTSDSGGSRGETQGQHGLGLGPFVAEIALSAGDPYE